MFARDIPSLHDTAAFTINRSGTSEKRLLPGTAAEIPRWSPDGSEIALLTCANPPDCTTAAAMVNPNTGKLLRWFPSPDPNLFLPCNVWLADGRRLACQGSSDAHPGRNGIYSIRSSDGKGLRRITANPNGDDSPGDYSPNGKRIVFLRTNPNRPNNKNQALFVRPVDGSIHARRITPWGLSQEPGSWSPNGRKILFAGNGSLYVVGVRGGRLRPIHVAKKGAAFDPTWAPNGKRIVFGFYAAGTQQSDIWTARPDGSHMQQVTHTKHRSEHYPDWGRRP